MGCRHPNAVHNSVQRPLFQGIQRFEPSGLVKGRLCQGVGYGWLNVRCCKEKRVGCGVGCRRKEDVWRKSKKSRQAKRDLRYG